MLSRLKEIFDQIEIYDPTQNIGLRSLKNIGVWLSAYALTEKEDQDKLVKELAIKTGADSLAIFVELKELATELSKPLTLEHIIKDYEEAQGTFDLTVPTEKIKKLLEAKITEQKLDFLLPHVKVNQEQDAALLFLMKNKIKFAWSSHSDSPEPYECTEAKFRQEKMKFLEANSSDHAVTYGVVEYHNKLFHVTELGALQDKKGSEEKVNTTLYLIEPVNKDDVIDLQSSYLNIIEQVKKEGFNHQKTYELAKKNQKELSNLKITGKIKEDSDFIFTVRFPEISEALKTTEKRLGIYQYFAKKRIANMDIEFVKYNGERELTYDKNGGEIKNVESVKMYLECASMGPMHAVSFDYTVSDTFMMVYRGNDGVDYYPYLIANPQANLKMTFSETEVYPDKDEVVNNIQKMHVTKNKQTMFAPAPAANNMFGRVNTLLEKVFSPSNKQ